MPRLIVTSPPAQVDLGNADYSTFKYPPCPSCGGVLKPAVVFFGESVPDALRDRSYHLLEQASAFLLVGTSLATYSAYRLVKAAIEQGKPCLIINKGPTRADDIVEDKIELGTSEVLRRVAEDLARKRNLGGDAVLKRLLSSGKVVDRDLLTRGQRGVVSS